VTADDSHPIPHTSFSLTVASLDSRKGKRKKLEDNDGDLEEGRGRPSPPQMANGMSDDWSSVAASVAPSIVGPELLGADMEGTDCKKGIAHSP